MADDVQMGIYRHYKGNLYQVIGLGHDANAEDLYDHYQASSQQVPLTPIGERTVVVYIGLQLNGAHFGPRLAVRTLEDFLAWVHPEDGKICLDPSPLVCPYVDGAYPRFDYLGPVLTPEMINV